MSSQTARVLTKSVERKITDDWSRKLPTLGVCRPRWMVRRVGPLLVGICLDRDSGGEKYKPCFHVHFLGKDFPTVSLTLCSQLRAQSGGPDVVQVRWHEKKYEDALRRMIEQSPLPLQGPLSVEQVVGAYRRHAETPLGRRQRPALFGDCILLLSWCGRKDDAIKLLDELLAIEHGDSAYRFVGGREAFEQKMRAAIDSPEIVQRTVEEQIEKHGVGDVPTSELTC